MTVTSFFMLHVATALLPPHDEIDYEYYTILNLPKKSSVTVAQIRKAYKLLSLQLHPDKVTQKQRLNGNNNNNTAGTMSVEEAAQLYEKVQEAVNVLSDDQKRRVYINYNYSVARYKFVMREDSQNFIEKYAPVILLQSHEIMVVRRLVHYVVALVTTGIDCHEGQRNHRIHTHQQQQQE